MADPYAAFKDASEDPYAHFADAKPSVGSDVARGGLGGLISGVAGIPSMFANGTQMAIDTVVPKGLPRDAATFVRRALPPTFGGGMTSDELLSVAPASVRKAAAYAPQTVPGKIAGAVARNAPNALFPGSAAARTINVVAPAVGGLGGRAVAKAAGAGEKGQAVGEFVGSFAGGVAGNLRAPAVAKPAKAITVNDLRPAKQAAYAAVDNSGVAYSPEATAKLVQGVKSALGDEVDPDLHRSLTAVIKRRIEPLEGQPITLTKLDKVRQVINEDVLTPQSSKGERRLAYKLRDALDDFVEKAGPDDVIGGADPVAAAASLKTARDLNTRVAKIDQITEAQARATRRASASGSGGNIDNATRQEIRKVLERGRNWSPEERAALEEIVGGSGAQNALRTFGKMSPSGNGLMQGLNLSMAAKTGGLSLPVSASAMASKAIADGMTQKAVGKLIDLVASGQAPPARSLAEAVGGLRLDSSTMRALRAPRSPRADLAARAPKMGFPFGPMSKPPTGEVGAHGPILHGFEEDYTGAVAALKATKTGETAGVLAHPDVPGRISLVWGYYDPARDRGAGLAKMLAKPGHIVDDLPQRLEAMRAESISDNRIILSAPNGDRAVISKNFNGSPTAPWVLTAYEKGVRWTHRKKGQ